MQGTKASPTAIMRPDEPIAQLQQVRDQRAFGELLGFLAHAWLGETGAGWPVVTRRWRPPRVAGREESATESVETRYRVGGDRVRVFRLSPAPRLPAARRPPARTGSGSGVVPVAIDVDLLLELLPELARHRARAAHPAADLAHARGAASPVPARRVPGRK